MVKKPIFGCGWKMYLTDSEAVNYAKELKEKIRDEQDVELYVLPSFTAIEEVAKVLEDTSINIGAQNMCLSERGAYTGEVSILSLKEMKIKYVEIGHSERRKLFAEDNQTINKKIILALKHNIIPILCLGEDKNEKEEGLTEKILSEQLKTALKSVDYSDAKKIIFAYEPVWAIGKKDAASPEYVEKIHQFIRTTLKSIYHEATDNSEEFKIIYGGSVNPDNIEELIKQPDVDGGFVGRASLEINSYIDILNKIKKLR